MRTTLQINNPVVSHVVTFTTTDGKTFDNKQNAERWEARLAIEAFLEARLSSRSERDEVLEEFFDDLIALAPALRILLPPEED